jgi:Putative metallopeptidase
MKASRRNPAAAIAVGIALAALVASPALAQSPNADRTLANGESIVIDSSTFSVRPGSPKDLENPKGQPPARRLGANGVVIYRNADGLFMVDRAPPVAAGPETAAGGPPSADGPRTAAGDCGPPSAVRDQGASSPAPTPNQECLRVSGQRDMERKRPNAVASSGAPDDIEHLGENPRIHVEYQTPKDPAQQKVYDTVKQHRILEMVRKIFSPWNLGDIDLNIRTVSCGVSNAWYQRVGNVPTVSICYEYLQEIWDSMPEETKAVVGETMQETICGQLFFAVAHELGHAMFDIYDVPVFGRQEDAADQFATYIMLQFGGEQALRLIDGAAYGYHAYIQDLSTKPQVTLPLAAFSSDHGSPEERYFNLICTAYGYDARLFSIEVHKLPQSRAQKCKFEYEEIKYAMHTVFWSHLDQDKVKRVLAMNWFIIPYASAKTSKAD